jgi:hypothetical protein
MASSFFVNVFILSRAEMTSDSSRASGGMIRPARVNNVALAGLRMSGEQSTGGCTALHRRLFMMSPLARLEIKNKNY